MLLLSHAGLVTSTDGDPSYPLSLGVIHHFECGPVFKGQSVRVPRHNVDVLYLASVPAVPVMGRSYLLAVPQ